MKSLIALLALLCLNFTIHSQSANPEIRNKDGKKYQVYHVVSGDGWYSIAKKFQITYAELRLANKAGDDKLTIGRELLIPLTKLKSNDPFFDKNYLDTGSNLINGKPLFHIVESSQTLYSLSRMYHVSTDDIKKWNNLRSNDIKKGQKLIVGKSNSDFSKNIDENNPNKQASTEIQESTTTSQSDIRHFTIIPVPSEEEEIEASRCEEPIYINRNYDVFPSNEIGDSVCYDRKSHNEKTAQNDELKLEQKNEISTQQSNQIETNNVNEDKIIFSNDRKEIIEEGYAAFISDKESNNEKYFAYHRTAPNGTIIKLSNVLNDKNVFVKVVGGFPGSQYPDEVIILISNTSAEKLGITEPKFQIKLQYGIDKEK